jgi:hypothetical protein
MGRRPTGAATGARVSSAEWPVWYAESVALDQSDVDLSKHAAFMARLQDKVTTERRMGDMLLKHMSESRRPVWRCD